ncbi:hypothetical protein [Rhodococcus tibetensis]|uniref:hypothetical protein n=1 Tax=Rhodococcus tibetensis TaxID=2965064 RepID=UPI0027E2516A|nr:hypothetical protein [Rhodococcus sp. FXJ9.536]
MLGVTSSSNGSWFRETLIADGERETDQLRPELDTRTTLSQALVTYSQHRNVKLRE